MFYIYSDLKVLSESVATAIEICEKNLELKEFENSFETCKFLRMFNKAFDLLDSKNQFNYLKPAIKVSNKETWTEQFNQIEIYINSLHMEDPGQEVEQQPPNKKKKMRDTRATVGSRKRGFLGFLINFKSYREIFRIYMEKRNILTYILGHKLSQERILSLAFYVLY